MTIFFRKTLRSRLTISALAFLFILQPLAPAFAEESVDVPVIVEETPAVSEDTIPNSSEEISSTEPVSEKTLEPEVEENVLEPENEETKEETQKENLKKETPQAEALSLSSTANTFKDSLGMGSLGNNKKLLPEIDPSSGALLYSYHIETPPGRNGIEPDLNLVYNSQDTDQSSVFGLGWSVDIPYITRVNKTGTNKLYTDNYFSSSMSGELISLGSGNYVAKTENGDFLKYSYSSNVWTVTDKTGRQFKFGTNATERQNDPNDSSHVFKWMLEEVRDTNDNFARYTYYKNSGQIYPYKVYYTGTGSTDGLFEVEFLRESRSDLITSSRPGFVVTSNYRINEIQAKVSSAWTKKYTITYTTGDQGAQSLLNTIVETGKDDSGGTVSLPAFDFDYQLNLSSGNQWAYESGWNIPVPLDRGVLIGDVNGDGLNDLVQSHDCGCSNDAKGTYLNDGDSWNYTTDWDPPINFYDGSRDVGARMIDLNGDGLVDIVYHDAWHNETYMNDGSGWTLDSNWATPNPFIEQHYYDTGARLVDINGDGLPDFISAIGDNSHPQTITTWVKLNTGSGWGSWDSSWTSPVDFTRGTTFGDFNGDGLTDIMQSWDNANHYADYKKTYLFNGDHTWVEDSNLLPPDIIWDAQSSSSDTGSRIGDINGDNLSDYVMYGAVLGGPPPYTYMNEGDDFSTDVSTRHSPYYFVQLNNAADVGTRLTDVNGDALLDVIKAENSSAYGVNLNQGKKANLLLKITYPQGGYTDVTYKASGKYFNGSTQLNPSLPVIQDTVYQISTIADGVTSGATYSYENGDYYYDSGNVLDRKFAGFGLITKTDSAGNVTKTFYHQGNSSDTTHGEYSDTVYKIGKPYRVEMRDGSGNLYSKTINKWDQYHVGSGQYFVKLIQSVESTYDGDSSHKDKASAYTNDNANGNLTQKIEYGEVTGSDNGTFTDTGTDDLTTDYEYATDGAYIVGLPKRMTVTNNNAAKVRESKYYYDTQSFGTVTDGNLTKQEDWKVSSTYINNQKGYNSYGLITSETDPRGKVTSYSYDTYNLYPTTITNPLSQATGYTFDYSSGKVKQTTDPNTRVFQNIYDGLDRLIEQKQPDLASPGSLVTKTAYTYTDTSGAVKVQKSEYLDGSTVVDTYTYFDGINRKIQERKEAEGSNYSVKDFAYNNLGLLQKESLPYFSSGSSKTSATGTNSLYTNYTHDPMRRVLTVVDNVGTTTNTYADWKLTITDPRTKAKDLYKDAFGNLIRVDEHNSGNTYSTYYEYDGNNKLTKLTDALGNVRNFTYDGLGRRLTAQDLHASADATFGSWSYGYDEAGNLTQVIDPKSQTINYTYDDVNRKLTENFTGQGGTEVTYAYDSGTDGIGRLTSVTSAAANSAYVYNPHGKVKTETKTLNSVDYDTEYTYDRQGNTLELTNPDDSKVKYTYNSAGHLETVQRKESTDVGFIDVVTDFDYGPHEKITNQEFASGVTTTNTYDATKLYRLSNKFTSAGVTQATSFYSGSGDGIATTNSGGWDYQHDSINANFADDTSSTFYPVTGYNGGNGNYMIGRGFFPFDTSSLPDGAVITSANFKVYVETNNNDANDGYDWMSVVNTTQSSNTAISTSDFDNAGAIDNPTEGVATINRKDFGAISTGQYLTFPLNSTGLSWVSTTGYTKLGLREGHDITDTPYPSVSGYNYLILRTSEYSGTSYDPVLEVSYTTGATLQDLDYTYDANGNITQIVDSSATDSSKTVDYVYDDLNRLTSATATSVAGGQSTYTKTYTYDAIGNILTSDLGTYDYEGDQGASKANPHAVTSIGAQDFTYDNNGNLTDDETWTHTWDYNNRMIESDDGATTVEYEYDYNGQRTKLDNGIKIFYYPSKYFNIEGSNEVKHIFAGDQLVATVEGSGASVNVYSLHTDHLSGSSVVTDDTGALEQLLDYYPYGGIRIDDKAGSFDEQRKFTGYELDSDTGLNYANARYYNSALGRFASQDSMFLDVGFDLTDPQSLNSYAYARNNPTRYNDLDGKWFMDVIAGKQSWNSFVTEVGDAANYLYNNNATWQTAMDHPVAAGAVVGVAGGAAAVVGAAAAPAAISYMTSSQALTGAGINVASQVLQDATSGQFSGVGTYAYSAVTGAAGGGAKGGVVAQGLIAGGFNYTQQRYVQGKQDVDWGSVATSAGSAAVSSKVAGSKSLNLSTANRTLGQTVLNGMFETPSQVINVGLQRSQNRNSYPANFVGPIPPNSKKGK